MVSIATGTAANIHDCLIQLRVQRVTENGALSAVMAYLRDQGQVSPQVIPYSDGVADYVQISFTCSHGRVSKHLAQVNEHAWALDCSVIKLAVAKDMREPDLATEQTETLTMHAFKETVASRIAVENILYTIHENASFTFDFVCMICCAAVVAGTGLMTNNAVTIVASMLISPLMNPILAFTFGGVVRDVKLIKVGITSTLLGMFICELIGFFGGLIAAQVAMRDPPTWPTNEMASRGVPSALYIGVAIAIPSGAAVALSLTSSNTSGLVGVAISASLLPPIVNSGILFAQAIFLTSYYNRNCSPYSAWEACCVADAFDTLQPTSTCPETGIDNFCCSGVQYPAAQIANMGGYSLALTVVNIVCIWFMASLTFLLKEVAPWPGKNTFWKEYVPATRRFNALFSSLAKDEEWRATTIVRAVNEAQTKGDIPVEVGRRMSKRMMSITHDDEF